MRACLIALILSAAIVPHVSFAQMDQDTYLRGLVRVHFLGVFVGQLTQQSQNCRVNVADIHDRVVFLINQTQLRHAFSETDEAELRAAQRRQLEVFARYLRSRSLPLEHPDRVRADAEQREAGDAIDRLLDRPRLSVAADFLQTTQGSCSGSASLELGASLRDGVLRFSGRPFNQTATIWREGQILFASPGQHQAVLGAAVEAMTRRLLNDWVRANR